MRFVYQHPSNDGRTLTSPILPVPCQVLQPVCHTRALQLWTAVYLPSSSPCTAAEDAMELYLSPSTQGDELTSRSLDRWVHTQSVS